MPRITESKISPMSPSFRITESGSSSTGWLAGLAWPLNWTELGWAKLGWVGLALVGLVELSGFHAELIRADLLLRATVHEELIKRASQPVCLEGNALQRGHVCPGGRLFWGNSSSWFGVCGAGVAYF